MQSTAIRSTSDSSLNGQTIMLTSGELLVDKSVTISGPGANMLAVDANHASRVFYIARGQRRYHLRADYLQWESLTPADYWRRYLQ